MYLTNYQKHSKISNNLSAYYLSIYTICLLSFQNYLLYKFKQWIPPSDSLSTISVHSLHSKCVLGASCLLGRIYLIWLASTPGLSSTLSHLWAEIKPWTSAPCSLSISICKLGVGLASPRDFVVGRFVRVCILGEAFVRGLMLEGMLLSFCHVHRRSSPN